jgi:hypothetical protein
MDLPDMSADRQSRTRVRVNSGWRFAFSQDIDTVRDGACVPPGLAWRDVSLPHTWTTYETTGADHVFIRDNPHIQVEIKQAIDCPVAMPVRSTGEPGVIVVTASSPGLIAGNVRIEARTRPPTIP